MIWIPESRKLESGMQRPLTWGEQILSSAIKHVHILVL